MPAHTVTHTLTIRSFEPDSPQSVFAQETTDIQVMLGGETVGDTSSFQLLGYCPQHDALWKNVTLREHIECYAAIRGVSKADTPRYVDATTS
jgi:ABC-type multidrug transport system ATPase subunit